MIIILKVVSFNEKGIMSPSHRRWEEFRDRLQGIEGCNFRKDDNNKTIWNCGGNHLFSRTILKSMPEIDIEKTINYFETHGGYCDCEVLFNVDTINLLNIFYEED